MPSPWRRFDSASASACLTSSSLLVSARDSVASRSRCAALMSFIAAFTTASIIGVFQFNPGLATRANFPRRCTMATCAVSTVKNEPSTANNAKTTSKPPKRKRIVSVASIWISLIHTASRPEAGLRLKFMYRERNLYWLVIAWWGGWRPQRQQGYTLDTKLLGRRETADVAAADNASAVHQISHALGRVHEIDQRRAQLQ